MANSDPIDLKAYLKALTPEAWEALDQEDFLISHFPFHVGRERRLKEVLRSLVGADRRRKTRRPTNDLYLSDLDVPKQISDRHFAVERVGNLFTARNLGTCTGLIVEGVQIGEHPLPGKIWIQDSDVIIVGSSRSPYVFKFLVHSGSSN